MNVIVTVFAVNTEEAGQRLDRLLAQRFERPRNQVQRWIDEGRVRDASSGHKAGLPLKASARLEEGDRVEVELPTEPPDPGLEAEAGELRILHEDAAVVVLDKPAGLAVHPGAGRDTGTLAHRLLHRYPEIAGVGGPGRPGIVHRLDQGTTGVLVAARTEAAYLALQRAFADRTIEKHYLAIAYGTPPPEGEIDRPIGRDPRDRKRMAVREGHRPALTRFRTRAAASGVAWLEIELLTGRTHQVRVHLKAAGHPLVGDPVYGEARWRGLAKIVQRPLERFPRPALHAWRLAFDHPETGERARFEAAVPDDLAELWQRVTGTAPPTADTW